MDRKEALRLLMKGTAAERKQRLEHPLVRYNDLGQIVCKLCNTVVKSEVAWNTHLVSRQHKETVARLKSKAATKQAQSAAVPAPQPGSARKASDLPSDFFDTPKSKSSKGAAEKPAPVAKASNPPRKPPEPTTAPATLPPGFFDTDNHKAGSIPASKGADDGAPRIEPTSSTPVDQQKQKDSGAKGVLPKGFFDDKEKDHKARGEEAPRVDINEEWKQFQKSVQGDLAEVDVRQEEEEAEAADEREEREVIEQRSFLQHIQELKRQKEAKAKENAAAAAAARQANGKPDEEEKSASDSDDEDEDFALHWRAKKV